MQIIESCLLYSQGSVWKPAQLKDEIFKSYSPLQIGTDASNSAQNAKDAPGVDEATKLRNRERAIWKRSP